MKKALLLTLYGNVNYGNKLQNYAVQKILEKKQIEATTVVFRYERSFFDKIKYQIKRIVKRVMPLYWCDIDRSRNFKKFDDEIKKIHHKRIKEIDKYDFAVMGSDQIWNPLDAQSNQAVEFVNSISLPVFSFSSSISIGEIPEKNKKIYSEHFNKMAALSIREDDGRRMLQKMTGRNDIEVLLDPSMLINVTTWNNMCKKPRDIKVSAQFILLYFIGGIDRAEKNKIYKYSREHNYDIVDLLDRRNKGYRYGPSEFLYLEKNAKAIFTDSFHSSAFAIKFHTPFIVYARRGGQHMGSRIDTLLKKFDMQKQKNNGLRIEDSLSCDFSGVDKIFERETKKADRFLNDALERVNRKDGKN